MLLILLSFVCFANAKFFLPWINHAHKARLESLQSVQAGPPKQWFSQILNHFDAQDTRRWQQRFYVNDTFFNSALGGPVFFQIGGEGAISPAYVTRLQMVNYAQQAGALCVTLEHRFYGESHPLPDLDTNNLQYLSSEQALADAAEFIAYIKQKYPTAGDVISFGGSYPGALTAWFRYKFPAVTKGAVASSAPVQATLDMTSYLNVVGRSLDKIGGKLCDAQVRAATSQLDSMLNTAAGLAKVSSMFSTCSPLTMQTPLDTATFLSAVIGNFMGVVQYDKEIPNAPTVKDLCKEMEHPGRAPLDSFLAVSNLFLKNANASCVDVSYKQMIKELRNVNNWGVTGVGDRQWTYQTCAEFGFYQTTDSAAQPFGTGVPLSYYLDMCKDVFGLTNPPRVNFTNAYYGGNKPYGSSNIVFVNGNVDPWSSLSVLKSLSQTVTAIEIDGGAHCSNMSPWHPGMNPNIKIAQTKIMQTIQLFLNAMP